MNHDRALPTHTHTNIPFIKSRLPCFRINMESPSSFFHVTRGIGLPVARHVSAASSPSCTAISTDESSFIISGGTVSKTRRVRMNHTHIHTRAREFGARKKCYKIHMKSQKCAVPHTRHKRDNNIFNTLDMRRSVTKTCYRSLQSWWERHIVHIVPAEYNSFGTLLDINVGVWVLTLHINATNLFFHWTWIDLAHVTSFIGFP